MHVIDICEVLLGVFVIFVEDCCSSGGMARLGDDGPHTPVEGGDQVGPDDDVLHYRVGHRTGFACNKRRGQATAKIERKFPAIKMKPKLVGRQ